MLNHSSANYELLKQFMMSNDGVELLDEGHTVLNFHVRTMIIPAHVL